MSTLTPSQPPLAVSRQSESAVPDGSCLGYKEPGSLRSVEVVLVELEPLVTSDIVVCLDALGQIMSDVLWM